MDLEIPTVLSLSKRELTDALVYLPPNSSSWWSQQFIAGSINSLEAMDAARAMEIIAETVVTYGQSRIHDHQTPPEVEAAARRAVERLWPEVK